MRSVSLNWINGRLTEWAKNQSFELSVNKRCPPQKFHGCDQSVEKRKFKHLRDNEQSERLILTRGCERLFSSFSKDAATLLAMRLRLKSMDRSGEWAFSIKASKKRVPKRVENAAAATELNWLTDATTLPLKFQS